MAGLSRIEAAISAIAERGLAERAAEAGVSVAEQRALERRQQSAYEEEHAKREAEHRARREEARAERDGRRRQLGEELGLGVACHIGHVVKLSGLSARSAGNGWDNATVWHAVIDEPLASGRLRREPGDLLCRKRSTLSLGTMGISGRGDWGCGSDPDPDVTPVTCKACQDRLRRFRQSYGGVGDG